MFKRRPGHKSAAFTTGIPPLWEWISDEEISSVPYSPSFFFLPPFLFAFCLVPWNNRAGRSQTYTVSPFPHPRRNSLEEGMQCAEYTHIHDRDGYIRKPHSLQQVQNPRSVVCISFASPHAFHLAPNRSVLKWCHQELPLSAAGFQQMRELTRRLLLFLQKRTPGRRLNIGD